MTGSRNSVLNEERRRAIVDLVREHGRVLVHELATSTGASESTVRRDLDLLHDRGLICRTHGGALPVLTAPESDFDLAERELSHPGEKNSIALAAARMVQEGQTIIIGSGSTTTAIAHAVRDFKNLRVITNGMSVVDELTSGDVEVILTGGTLRKSSRSLIGLLAEHSLSGLRADIFFMGTDGIDTKDGFFTQNLLGAQLVRVMVEVSARTIVAADSSKFGKTSLYTVVPISKVQGLITDRGISPETLQALQQAGIEVTLA